MVSANIYPSFFTKATLIFSHTRVTYNLISASLLFISRLISPAIMLVNDWSGFSSGVYFIFFVVYY